MAGEGPVFRFEGTAPRVWVEDSVIAPARDAEVTLVAADDPGGPRLAGPGQSLRPDRGLPPADGPAPGFEAIRDWSVWEEGLTKIRETGSLSTRGLVWEDADHIQALAQESQNPTPAFRLAAMRPDASAAGARKGRSGRWSRPPGSPRARSSRAASLGLPWSPRPPGRADPRGSRPDRRSLSLGR